jgi:hypothetical protein
MRFISMRASYSKVWMVVAGTVAGMTALLHAAYPNGRASTAMPPIERASTTSVVNGAPDPILAAPWLDAWALDASAGIAEIASPLHRASPGAVRSTKRSGGSIAASAIKPLWSHTVTVHRPDVAAPGSMVTLTSPATG